jgi:N-glycosylase/DNA lyase
MDIFSTGNYRHIEEIRALYQEKRREICLRLEEFKGIWDKCTREELFAELVYCIITPMARGSMCCAAVDTMVRTGILFTGTRDQIKARLIGARFIHKKSAYIVEAREKFLRDGSLPLKSILGTIDEDQEAREWLVDNVKGIGYKEASHFLRNTGFTQDLAILDRHIVRNLHSLGVIEEAPETLSRRRYLDIEKRMREFSGSVQIPMGHLDLLLWYKETGEILK